MKTVNIRALKDKLSAYLRDAERGEVFLVTDRGRVIAEIRRPTMSQQAADLVQEKLQRMADQGFVRLGLPNDDPSIYRNTLDIRLSAEVIDAALAWTREDPS